MSYWKVLGGIAFGAASGVVAMVALPVLAPIGVITAVGAGIGVGVGGTLGGAGGIVASASDEATREGYERRVETAEAKAAEYAVKVTALSERLARAAVKLRTYGKFEEFIVALAAIGFSIAAADGEVSAAERTEIEEFLTGVSYWQLPEHVQDSIAALAADPPSLNAAFSFYEALDPSHRDTALGDLVEDLIALLSVGKDQSNDDQAVWKAAWTQRRAEAA